MLFAATTISRAPVVLIAAVAIGAVAPGFLTSEPTAETELEPATTAPEWDSFRAENLALSVRSLEGLSDESKVRAVSTSLRQPGSAFTVATPRHRRGATTTDRAAVAAGQRPHAASRPGCRSSVLGHPGGSFSTAD